MVHKAMYKQHVIALKVFKFKQSQFDDTTLSKFESELRILKLLTHERVALFLGFRLNIKRMDLNIAFEFAAHGNLFQLLHHVPTHDDDDAPESEGQLSYREKLRILSDIAQGMEFVHFKRVI